jgi:beta-glucosidase
MSHFPSDFTWGAATASYQIEGAVAEDGRKPSIWDTFSHTPGKTRDGDTGDVACDHYHHWRDDIALMRALGLNGYRFSIAWSRILPDGVGAVNTAGLDFYDRLVDGLLEAKIAPAVTLYHWDLPQALQDRGGWANREVAEWFAEYTEVVVRRLGDRVKRWITHNEPQVFTFVGHRDGRHAPGHTDIAEALKTVHYALLAHGRAIPIIRRFSPDSEVGITLNLYPIYPVNPTRGDRTAVYMRDAEMNRIFLDPIFGKGYPDVLPALFDPAILPEVHPGDLYTIATPIDFLGINYYMQNYALYDPKDEQIFRQLSAEELADRGHKLTEMGWPIDANALIDLLSNLQRNYAPKAMYITENGAAFPDKVMEGKVDDPDRIDYLRAHLTACETAIARGIPLKGYYLWSMFDNFEWGHGYSKRFGITYVDYATQQRIPKGSYYFYQNVIKNGTIE